MREQWSESSNGGRVEQSGWPSSKPFNPFKGCKKKRTCVFVVRGRAPAVVTHSESDGSIIIITGVGGGMYVLCKCAHADGGRVVYLHVIRYL